MKVKTKKVYYCKYCKKHFLLPCQAHEKKCTANPNRKCGLCENQFSIDVPKIIEKYQKSYTVKEGKGDGVEITWKDNKKIKLEDIMDDVEGCPVCALTVLRCSGLNKFPMSISIKLEEETEKYYKEQEDWDERSRYY